MEKQTLLIVDDAELNRDVLAQLFVHNYNILQADNGVSALQILRDPKVHISLVLLDIIMPKMDGLEVLRQMHSDPSLADIPVIVASAADETEVSLQAVELGALDFIAKPFDPDIIKIRVRNVISRYENIKLHNQNKLLLMQHKQEQKYQRQLKYIAEHDHLTGLYNRNAFFDTMKKLIKKNPNTLYAIGRFDIDRFKVINDIFGYEEGNRLLCSVAKWINNYVKKIGVCCRINADNFAFCVPFTSRFIDKLISDCNNELKNYDLSFDIKACFGIYIITETHIRVEQMLDRAQLAQRSIKGNYLTLISYYDDRLRLELLREQEIINDMNKAFEEKQFIVYLQPKCRIATGEIIGAEALVRWMHPKKGLIPPGDFIPIFEKNGFIMKLDAYIWEQVCRILRYWINTNKFTNCPSISTNISRVNLYNPNLCNILINLVKKYNIPPNLLELEITESAYSDNPKLLSSVIDELHNNGFTIQMDDFGSGYSSLNMLKDIAVDVLKIDMNFLYGTDESGRGGSILTSVVRMARWLKMSIIAEGVETETQANFLNNIGCPYAQGYLFYKPMSVDDFENIISNQPSIKQPNSNVFIKDADWDKLLSVDSSVSPLLNNIIGAIGIFEMFDTHLDIVRLNNEYYKITETSVTDLQNRGLNVRNWIHKDDWKVAISIVKKALETVSPQECTLRIKKSNGDYKSLRSRIFFSPNDKNKRLFCASLTNIVQINVEEEMILYSKDHFFNLFPNDNFIIWHFDFKSLKVSHILRPPNTYSFDDKLSNIPYSLIENGLVHPDDQKHFLAMYDKIFSGEPTVSGVFRLRMPDGPDFLYRHIRFITLYDHNNIPYSAIGISNNITDSNINLH